MNFDPLCDCTSLHKHSVVCEKRNQNTFFLSSKPNMYYVASGNFLLLKKPRLAGSEGIYQVKFLIHTDL